MSSQPDVRVVVIVDRNFGSSVEDVATHYHTWIIDTPANRIAVEGIWKLRRSQPESSKSLTLFDDQPSMSLDDLLATMLGTIEEHHPGLNRVEVRGISFTPLIEQALRDFGFGNVTSHTDGFVVTR
jgi:hypothetical protein